MAEGIVFDVQRFSVNDGPGIRTTVFFKGCPLRCRWCHNPEGLTGQKQWRYFAAKCLGCGRCTAYTGMAPSYMAGRSVCSVDERPVKSDEEEICLNGALLVSGKSYIPSQLVELIQRDADFYGEQGGVTFSGGEATLQADFVEESLRLCREKNIHTALDTCGYAATEVYRRLLPLCDLVLFDIKGMDDKKHLFYTGKSNALIHENFRYIASTGVPVWIRIPLIPGYTADLAQLQAVVDFLIPYKQTIQRVTLMPYHSFGNAKYQTLGLCPETFEEISDEAVAGFKELFLKNGFTVED